MQKKQLYLAAILLISAIIISGCAKKADNPPITKENVTNNQNPAQTQNPDQTQNQEQIQNQEQVNNQTTELVNPSGLYSINELFAMKRPMKCTWKESAQGDSDVSNIIYINAKKFYQDVTMGDIGHSYMIYDEEYLYIWNSFNDIASKMKETKATTATEPKKDSAGLDQKKDFVCENWKADNSIFIPPHDKNFKDVTEEMTQAVQEMQAGGLDKAKQQICDLCQKAPTKEIRDKCLADSECDK